MDDSGRSIIFQNATAKQIEVLDLAAEGLTSKQIARELGVVPRTVDQRIDAVRSKLGGAPRHDVLRYYRAWRETYDRTTYDPFPLTARQPFGGTGAPQPGPGLVFQDVVALDGRANWDRPGDWLRPEGTPNDLDPGRKLLLVLGAAVVLLVSFALIVATAQGIGDIARSMG